MTTQVKTYTDRHGVAAGGHDVVSFHDSAGPVSGLASIEHTWRGATWRFATESNRDSFVEDPERYAPQFGGHCAFGRALGVNVKGIPKRWSIDESGRLYFNKNVLAQAMAPLLRSRIESLASKS